MSENVAPSLDAVLMALGHLRNGLAQGGFADALPTYRQMAEIVAAQRLTTSLAGDQRFDARFAEVAGLAAEIGQMLAPWGRLMDQLAGMDAAATGVRQAISEETSSGAEQASGSLADAVLAWLAEHRGPQTVTRIRVGVARPAAEVTKALAELVMADAVTERHVGRRRLWEARPGAVTSPG
jgi:hypothetical protein